MPHGEMGSGHQHAGHQHDKHGHFPPAASAAPESVRFCQRCATALTTRQVGDRARRTCPSCGYVHYTDPKVGVGVLVTDDDRVLLVRRTAPPGKGLWSLPGGFLDAGEDPRQTAAREVLEETGLAVSVGRVLDVFYNGSGPGASVFLLYVGSYRGGKPVAGDDAGDARFFSRAELPRLAFASTEAAVRNWTAEP